MKRINVIGLCLMAALAVSAVAVASASAALPEFKPAGGTFPVTFTSESVLPLEPTLAATIAGTPITIQCQMSTDKGEIRDAKLVAKILVTYVGCKAGANPCTTAGLPSGVIHTLDLHGLVGYTLPRSGLLTGLELLPENSSSFAHFNCGALLGNVLVEGCIIGHASPINVSQATGTLLFEENVAKTAQKFTEIEGGVHKPCELTVKTAAGNGTGRLMDKELETFSVAVELKA